MTVADLSAAIAALHVLRPQWLWALLAVPVLVLAWQLRRRRQSAWRGAVDAHLLPHLLESRAVSRGQWAPWLLALAYALGVIALAGPSWERGVQPLLQTQAPLVIALDLSGATLANDLPPSRLVQARAKIDTLLRQRAGGQSGLIAFADDAYTVAPLTDDAANVALFLDALTPDVMPVDGSNAARAISRAVALMTQAGFDSGDILVVSDHADDDARDAARDALAKGFRVSALGLGSDAGAAFRLPDGRIERTRLDAGSLRALVSAGGGRYAALGVGTADLDALGVLRPGADAAQSQSKGEAVTVWRDGGYWLLPPLMLLVLLAFRRGSAFVVVVACALMPWQVLRADGGPSLAGNGTPGAASTTATDGSLWRRADQAQHARMVEGEAAYRKKDYAGAARAWRAVPGADAAYNRGNALAQAGRYDEAIAAYDQALREQPAMADAVANRAAVDAARKRKPPPGKGNKSGKPQDGKDGKPGGQSDPKDSQPDQPSGEQEGQGSGQPPPGGDAPPPRRRAPPGQPPPPDGNSPDDPDRAQNQRQADAAQREQMRRELDRQANAPANESDKTADAPPQPSETPRQREQRQANDAWLRRVPDDPGGLLRAKFRLEYERRQQTGEP